MSILTLNRSKTMYFSKERKCHGLAFVAVMACGVASGRAFAQLHSYADEITSVSGAEAAALQSTLGPPDYLYPDAEFPAGASAVFNFPAPIDDVEGDDLLLYAFVTGAGSDSSTVRVEARAIDADPFVTVAEFDTADARIPDRLNPYATFDHVHAFAIDFDGRARKVTQVRITNLAGDPIRLDALEGVHPALQSPAHAVELRIFRLRDDESKRFALRFKNLGGLQGGAAVSGFSIEHATDPVIDQTNRAVVGEAGQFDATAETTAGADNGDVRQRTDYVWNVAGEGLMPGGLAAHQRFDTIDTDTVGDEFLENFVFTVIFTDGTVLQANWNDVMERGAEGRLFALYQWPPDPVSINEERPAYFLEVHSATAVVEPPCTDCATNDDSNDPEDHTDDGNNDVSNGSNGGAAVRAPCGAGMISAILFTYSFLVVMRLRFQNLNEKRFFPAEPVR